MSSDLALTPYERKLCITCALAWVVGLSIAYFAAGLDYYLRWGAYAWAMDQWQSLLAAELPEFSIESYFNLLALGTLSGALLLVPQYVAHLVARGRWLSPVALWFWTMLHATLPVALSLSVLGILSLYWRANIFYGVSFPMAALWFLLLAVSVSFFFASRRAWQRRRRIQEKLNAE